MKSAPALFAVLADPTRLRLLRALVQDRFNVSELTAIVAVSQSGVSRHLALLREAGLVTEERDRGFVYYRPARTDADRTAPLWRLLDEHFEAAADETARQDDARLQDVLRQRREGFDAHGDPRQLVPGRSWAAWARALGHLLPPLDAADIGCGEGYLALEMAAWARSVVGIDRSDHLLERAKGLAGRRGITNVEWKKGDLARLPLRDASVDLALLSHALHHASEPERAVADAVRITRPGGRILILDLKAHDQTWVRSRFGDRRLGFAPGELEALLAGAGLVHVRVTTGSGRRGDPFVVLVASGAKPAGPLPKVPRARAARTPQVK
jgi:ArsR family transcriptional regulator